MQVFKAIGVKETDLLPVLFAFDKHQSAELASDDVMEIVLGPIGDGLVPIRLGRPDYKLIPVGFNLKFVGSSRYGMSEAQAALIVFLSPLPDHIPHNVFGFVLS